MTRNEATALVQELMDSHRKLVVGHVRMTGSEYLTEECWRDGLRDRIIEALTTEKEEPYGN